MAFNGSVKDLFRQEKFKEPKLVQVDKVLTVMHSEAKLMPGPVVTEKAKCFYDEMKIIDMCMFSDGWLQKFKELTSL